MSIEAWWPRIGPASREWLVENNGDVVPAAIVEEITRVGGRLEPDAWWVGESGRDGLYLSDDAVDWVEAVANGETPDPPVLGPGREP